MQLEDEACLPEKSMVTLSLHHIFPTGIIFGAISDKFDSPLGYSDIIINVEECLKHNIK